MRSQNGKTPLLPDFDLAADHPSPLAGYRAIRDDIYKRLRRRELAAANPLWRVLVAAVTLVVWLGGDYVVFWKRARTRV
jgi:hypothetical protein